MPFSMATGVWVFSASAITSGSVDELADDADGADGMSLISTFR